MLRQGAYLVLVNVFLLLTVRDFYTLMERTPVAAADADDSTTTMSDKTQQAAPTSSYQSPPVNSDSNAYDELDSEPIVGASEKLIPPPRLINSAKASMAAASQHNNVLSVLYCHS